jgi:hypothetical protein
MVWYLSVPQYQSDNNYLFQFVGEIEINYTCKLPVW